MRSSALRVCLALACGLLACGCRSIKAGGDAKPPKPVANAPGTSINQASYEESLKGTKSPLPGISVEDIEPKRDWYDSLESLKPSNIKKSFLKATGQGPDEAIAKTLYQEGDELFRKGDYAEAAKRYKKAGKRWPSSTLEEDALFMRAESFFFSDHYSKAVDTYSSMLKKYENSRYLDKAAVRFFSIARYWEVVSKEHLSLVPNFTDPKRTIFDVGGNAISVYEAVRMADPTGPLADDAVFAEANAYFLRNRYEDADYHYDLLRKEYPRSEHQIPAHLLGVRAKLRSYQGAQYDAKPLFEADKLIDITLTQFVTEIPDERERLMRAKQAIRAQRAERDWENGEYYYRRHFSRAARFYYNVILRDFPDTNFAEMSQKRMEETKNLPPTPKNYFTWVGRIFGERERTY
jgi:outer membrane protein assembly factor BamD (BamD/ComL family)